jgi:hypothetical protein
MARLSVSNAGELCLKLAGTAENVVLTSLRRWPHWQRVAVERSPDDAAVCLSVTLATDPANEQALRNILKHGFGLTFPVEGGQSEGILRPVEPHQPKRARQRRTGI